VALFSLIVLAVVGGAIGTIYWYGGSAYYVGFSGEDVAIFQGRPGGVLWIQPERVETSTLQRDEVPEDVLDIIDAGKEQPSLEDAQAFVNNLEDRVAEQRRVTERDEAATTTTSTTSTTRPPTSTTAPRATTTAAP
jgi:protein phosphatase